MTHQLNMCCGTTCDKEVNLDYVGRLEKAVDVYKTKYNDAIIEARFYKDLYNESLNEIEKHYIQVSKT